MKRVELVDTGLHSTDLENLVVTSHPKFQAIMARSRARYEAEGGLSTEQVRRHLAGRRKTQQPARRRSSRKTR